jgi:hypothetical protein
VQAQLGFYIISDLGSEGIDGMEGVTVNPLFEWAA